MTQSDRKPEVEKLVDAGLHLTALGTDAVARKTICTNLETVLMLAKNIEDFGYEAAPIFRA